MLRRRLKLLGKIFLGFIVLVVALLFIERWRGQISVARFKRELAAKGETLDVQKLLAPTVADEENGASEIIRLKDLLQEGKIIPQNHPWKMRMLASGRAIVGFREDFWIEEKVTNTWKDLTLDLAVNQQTLEQLRTALMKPTFDFKLDHSRGVEMSLLHLSPIKSLAQWLGTDLQHSLHNRENQMAYEDLLATIGLPKALENDRIIISELVRIVISAINLAATWEALQVDDWTEEQLAQIQAAWEKNTFATNMVGSLRVERADGCIYYDRFRRSNDETYKHMFPNWFQTLVGEADSETSLGWRQEFVRKQIYCRVWRFAWANQDERFYIESIQHLIDDHATGAEMAARPAEEYWFGLGKAPPQNFYDDWRFGMSAQSLASFSMARLKSVRAETERAIVLSAIALKRYMLRYGKPAPDLSALVPEFLTAVPIDYMDGQPIKYRLNADGSFTLYSAGEDGKDDGGDLTLPEGSKSRDLWKRRDYVWPAPATPEEVEEYRRKTGQD